MSPFGAAHSQSRPLPRQLMLAASTSCPPRCQNGRRQWRDNKNPWWGILQWVFTFKAAAKSSKGKVCFTPAESNTGRWYIRQEEEEKEEGEAKEEDIASLFSTFKIICKKRQREHSQTQHTCVYTHQVTWKSRPTVPDSGYCNPVVKTASLFPGCILRRKLSVFLEQLTWIT